MHTGPGMTARAPSLKKSPSIRTPAPVAALKTALRPTMMAGAIGSLALLVILIVWAGFTMISSAVISSGQVLVRGSTKLVQNVDGGVVSEILVKNGDTVQQDQVVVRLDPTLLRVNLDIARNRLAEALTQKARLEAEQLGLSEIDFAAMDTSDAAQHLGPKPLSKQKTGQNQIFIARRAVQLSSDDRLRAKISQIESQTEGAQVALAAKRDQLSFIQSELVDVVELNRQGLARQSQVLDLQRSQSEMLAQIAADQSQIATLADSVRDANLEMAQTRRTFQEEVVTKLGEVTTLSEELILQIVTTQKQLDRVEIRAPATGVVHELQVATVGGVLAAGATILQIVPLDEGLQFEFKLDPKYVDQVFVGQKAKLHFPAFSARSTPELFGSVTSVSPTSITEQQTGKTFYRLELDIPAAELARLGDSVLVPGMPVEAFLQAGDRSVLSYLIRPLSEQMNRAFRDE